MGKTTSKQYNPVSTSETSTDDTLSVRDVRDTGWGINNYKMHAGAHKLISCQFLPPLGANNVWENVGSAVAENLILYLGRFTIPNGFKQVRWWINSKRTAGSDRVDYTLISSPEFYVGPEAYDSTVLSEKTTDVIQCNADVRVPATSVMTLCRPDFSGDRWFYLTVECDAGGGDAATRADLYTIDVQLMETA